MDREHTIHIEPFILLPPNDAEKMSFLYLLDSEKKNSIGSWIVEYLSFSNIFIRWLFVATIPTGLMFFSLLPFYIHGKCNLFFYPKKKLVINSDLKQVRNIREHTEHPNKLFHNNLMASTTKKVHSRGEKNYSQISTILKLYLKLMVLALCNCICYPITHDRCG